MRRAVRLLERGVPVAQVAPRLGVDAGALRRRLVETIGATPDEVAASRRAALAAGLAEDTELPAAVVAAAAGFRSARACDEALRARHHRSVDELRTNRGRRVLGGLRLAAVAPFDPTEVLGFLAARAVPGIDEVEGSTYRRDGVEIAVDERGAVLHLGDRWAAVPVPANVAAARRLLDLDTDVSSVLATLGADPVLAPLVAAAPGLRVPGAWDGFEVLVRAIVGQQVTVAAARTLLGRLVTRCGGTLSPEAVLAADLAALGMPGARVDTLRAAAAAVLAGEVVLDASVATAEVAAALLGIRGVGAWTAQYVALRALGDPDAFPVGDAGLRAAARGLGLATDERSLAARAERWRPWRAYATVHLWRSLAGGVTPPGWMAPPATPTASPDG